ncbi:MAG: alcohol dehydrogenase catalytic domain-containing protein, partial [Desulfatiglandales bacterium]
RLPVPTLPVIMGHEGAGIVEAVGEGVGDFRSGDRVLLLPSETCGQMMVFGIHLECPAVPHPMIWDYARPSNNGSLPLPLTLPPLHSCLFLQIPSL